MVSTGWPACTASSPVPDIIGSMLKSDHYGTKHRINITDFQTHCISQFEPDDLRIVYLWQCLSRKISLCIDPKRLAVFRVICGLICCCHCGVLCLSTWRLSLYLALEFSMAVLGCCPLYPAYWRCELIHSALYSLGRPLLCGEEECCGCD